MNDLVSYREKHNEANGEGNRDGDNNNLSDNYGVEGPTRKKPIDQLRLRQIKNMIGTLLLSQGVPMLVMGDEARRTQKGNNNAYCQDNDTSWFNWSLVESNQDLLRFVRGLTAFRRQQPALMRDRFLSGRPIDTRGVPDVSWFESTGKPIQWDKPNGTLICWLAKPSASDDPAGFGRDLMIIMNGTAETKKMVLPEVTRGQRWRLFLDTSKESPEDIYPDLDGPEPPPNRHLELQYRSMMVFVAEA